MKHIVQNIGYGAGYFLTFSFSTMTINILYRFSNLVFLLVYHVFRYRRGIVIQNLSRAFPEKKYAEIQYINKQFYRSFVNYSAEILKAYTAPASCMREKVTFTGIDIIDRYVSEGKNVIVSLGHCGNWEMLNTLSLELKSEVYAVYKPLRNKILNRLVLKLRSRFGIKPIASKSVARYMLSRKDQPAVYLFLADQCPQKVSGEKRYSFLNQETSVYAGIEKLAVSTSSAVVYFHITQKSKGCYHVDCLPINDNVNIAQEYLKLLEKNIKEAPSGWLWTHKRWKR
ncbi:MAG: lysophospholipid acyltransferase family protein [Dysgonomonas sp.]|nr:lysophospholipid acyltransferase family protein [Dysgonomonas sp.]